MNYLAVLFLAVMVASIFYWVNNLSARVYNLQNFAVDSYTMLEVEYCNNCGAIYSRVQLRSSGILKFKCSNCGNELESRPCTCSECLNQVVTLDQYGPIAQFIADHAGNCKVATQGTPASTPPGVS